jgi:hypothetical protein
MDVMTTTPAEVTPAVLKLCRKLGSCERPVYVSVQPAADAAVKDCFINVQRRIEQAGGAIEHGWAIWEWPGVLIEAEFHAVWISPTGGRIDVSPRAHGEQWILFSADAKRTFQGKLVDNERLALRDDPLVRDFIALAHKRTVVMNRGDRAGEFGEISVPRDELGPLVEAAVFVETMLREGLCADDLCACGSGRKYKNCCGRLIRRIRT